MEQNIMDDKAFCEFLEWEVKPDSTDESKNVYWLPAELNAGISIPLHPLTTHFYKSWDWLMLVVDKIGSFQGPHIGAGVCLYSTNVTVAYNTNKSESTFHKLRIFSHGGSFDATYVTCLEFVHWYFKNIKKS